jgi:hypothetical protein
MSEPQVESGFVDAQIQAFQDKCEPCPWCGTRENITLSGHGAMVYVSCDECDVCGPAVADSALWEIVEERAIKVWNSRKAFVERF